MSNPDFISELKRRNVIRMAGLYLVGAWLITQVSATVLPLFGSPDWIARSIVVLLMIGFIPAMVVSWIFELTPDGLRRDSEVPETQSIAPQNARKMERGILVLFALALAFFGFDRLYLAPKREAALVSFATQAITEKAAQKEKSENEKSIAVLPFVNMSAEKDNEYFSDGVSEEILNALAQVRELKVAGRTSSFHFKGRNEPLTTIGKTLGVAHVLEGSVRKQGDKLRITAQLIRVSDGFHLWSDTFDGTDVDVFALQEKVARKVADELKVAMNLGAEQRLVNAGTKNPEAYALYLKATEIFNQRDGSRMREAVSMLEQAIALDPNYARAYSRLATLSWLLPVFTNSDPARSQEQVQASARRAIALDPRLAEPWAAMAMASALRGGAGMIQAREEFENALQLDPDDVTTNFWYGLTLARWGYQRAGEERMEHALAVDPMVPNVMRWRGVMYLRYGDVDGAEQYLKRAQATGLSLAGRELAEIVAGRGEIESARRLWKEGSQVLLTQLDGDSRPGFSDAVSTGLFGGNAVEREHAIAAIEAFLATQPKNIAGVTPMWLAQLGHGARALDVERTFVKTDNSDFLVYVFSPAGKSLRQLPEFPGYLKAKGFPMLWDKYGPPDVCSKSDKGDYVCE